MLSPAARSTPIRASSLLVIALLMHCPAYAAEGVAAADESWEDQPITVTSTRDHYNSSSTNSATKTDTPLIDIPQSIQIVTREQLEDQAHHSLGDVLRYMPGATVGQGEGNRDQITFRGQNTSADFFIDGVRDDVQYYRGLYNVERVEVLKGSNALIFGRGGGGGVLNRVQKAPLVDTAFAAAQISANSFGAWDLAADLNAPLTRGLAVRLNTTYERLNNHRDYVGGDRFAINPTLAAGLGRTWTLGLSYEYVRDDRVTDRGVPSIATSPGQPNRPITGYDKQFFGVPGVNQMKLDAHIAKLRVDGSVTDNLKMSASLLYGDYDKIYVNAYANGAATAQTGTVALDAYSDPTRRKNLIAQGWLVWAAQTGPLEHKILAGLEYADQDTRNQRLNRVFTPGNVLNLANPVFPSVAFTTPSRDTHSNVRVFSAYMQDQLSIGAHIDVVAGVRYDRFRIEGIDFIPNPDRPFARRDAKVSPRLGLILKPANNASLYASYSQSFLPRSGEQFTSLTITQQNLSPERFTNVEVGAKWDVRPDLSLTAALFQLDRTNATTPDPANPLVTINIGKTRTKGAELAITGRVMPHWQVSGGYSYQDAKLLGNGLVRLGQVPKHQASLWNRYDVTKHIGVGLGVIHQSSQFAAIRSTPSTTRLPGYTRVDAAVFFNLNDQMQLQANVENLTGTNYFSDAHNNNNISPGAPINGRVTLRVKF